MSKTVNINGENKTVDKVALWRDAAHTAREMFVPEGTVPPGYVPEGTVPPGYVQPETPTVSVTIASEGGQVVARATASANGKTGTGSASVLPGVLGLEPIGTIEEGYVLPTSRIQGQTLTLRNEAQTLPAGAYLEGNVIVPALPEQPEVSYDTPSVSVSIALSADNTKLVATATATANGKTGAGTGEATLASLGLVKPARTQAGGTITPGEQQVIPAGTYLSAALTILAASGGGGILNPTVGNQYVTGEVTIVNTTRIDISYNAGFTPNRGIILNKDFQSAAGEVFAIFFDGTRVITWGLRGGSSAGTVAGQWLSLDSKVYVNADECRVTEPGGNWFYAKPNDLSSVSYQYVFWRV